MWNKCRPKFCSPSAAVNKETLWKPKKNLVHDPYNDESEDESDGDDTFLTTPFLRQNMMRQLKNRDPYKTYEVLEVLGTGSMGSVSRVKKRGEVIGGSARHHNVSLKNRLKTVTGPFEFFKTLVEFHTEKHSGPSTENTVYTSLRSHGAPTDSLDSASGDIPSNVSLLDESKLLTRAGSCVSGITLPSNSQHRSRNSETLSPVWSPNSSLHDQKHTPWSASASMHGGQKYEVQYALKSIHLSRVGDESFIKELRNEIEILQRLDHPHIVRPIETYEYRKHLYMVMELCSGGDLYSRDPYTEEEAARIIGSILSAVAFMHENNVVHRDLKYENVMFVNSSPHSEIKLIDFGLSKKFLPEQKVMNEGVGTIYTMAPQVLQGKYTSKADVWSVGVLSYMLLSSQMPFYGKRRRDVIGKIMKCKYDFRGRRWRSVSNQAKNFVADLLQFKPEERPTAEEAQQSLWLNKRFAVTMRAPTDDVMDGVQASLETYSKYSKLKKLALMIIAHKSTTEEIGILRKAFQKYDTAMDGSITLAEFKEFLVAGGYDYSDQDLEEMFLGTDLDGTGQIRYTEFLAATIESTGVITEERLAEAFDRLDSDDSGYISTDNLHDILGGEVPREYLDEIIDEIDLSNNHRISYAEFLSLWNEHEEDVRLQTYRGISNRRTVKRVAEEMSLYKSEKCMFLSDDESTPTLDIIENTGSFDDSILESKESLEDIRQ